MVFEQQLITHFNKLVEKLLSQFNRWKNCITERLDLYLLVQYYRSKVSQFQISETSFSPLDLTNGPMQFWSMLWFDHQPKSILRLTSLLLLLQIPSTVENNNFSCVETTLKKTQA